MKSKQDAAQVFEIPTFGLANLAFAKLKLPPSVHSFSEKGLAQAKENCEQLQTVAEEASELIEDTHAAAANSSTNYNVKLFEAARLNATAWLDYSRELLQVRCATNLQPAL